MDSIFNLEETERCSLLRKIIRSCGFTYVCLWSHHSNCLIFTAGVYQEENNQASSSSGSLAMRSFLDYQKPIFLIDNYSVRVPGFAFLHNLTYMEHTGLELLQLASSTAQLQFYQEARIKTAIFMGCKNGEIELGMSSGFSPVTSEFELKKLFPGDFPQEVVPQPLDHASSLRSLSIENSVDYPPSLFNTPQASSYMPEISGFKEPFSNQQTPNPTPSSLSTRSEDPLQQALIQFRTSQLIPSIEHEEAEMTRAILAAISPPPPPYSSHQLQAPPAAASAFKRYRTYLEPIKRVQNLNIRSLSFFRNLSEGRAKEEDQMVNTPPSTSNQLHHMISERKRREKLNESFEALRSLLPPGSKKDKASVLSNINEYIASLKSQVEELNKRNKILEAEHSRKKIFNYQLQDSGGERLKVRITDVDGGVDLEVNVRGNLILRDLVVGVLEFMNQVENISVTSVDAAGTRMLETQVIENRVVLRLRIQGSEWNRSSIEEELTRVLDELAQ